MDFYLKISFFSLISKYELMLLRHSLTTTTKIANQEFPAQKFCLAEKDL